MIASPQRNPKLDKHMEGVMERYHEELQKDVFVAYYNEGEGDSHIKYFYDEEKAKDFVDSEIARTIDMIKYKNLTGDIIEKWYDHYYVEKIDIRK